MKTTLIDLGGDMGGFPDVFVIAVDTGTLEPTICEGDVVFVDRRRRGYERSGYYLMSDGSLARCQFGEAVDTVLVTRGESDDGENFSLEAFETCCAGMVFRRVQWFEHQRPDQLQAFLDQVGLPVVERSD